MGEKIANAKKTETRYIRLHHNFHIVKIFQAVNKTWSLSKPWEGSIILEKSHAHRSTHS
jgi:hypothetical protein